VTYILALDTTSKHSSAAISQEDDILVEYNFATLNKLSASLISTIEFVLNSAGLTPDHIDLYGIGIGPGLFTGIRVGLSTLKGLLFGKNKPIVPVVTLKALAYKYIDIKPGAAIITLVDARRDEVYFAGYNCFNHKMKEIIAPQLIHINRLEEQLYKYKIKIENLYFVGSGAEVHKEIIEEKFNPEKMGDRSPFLAPEICKIAYNRFLRKDYIEDLQKLMPFYIRKPDAEQNFNKS
jgi:tRNA threonylcarbamoyl adenosine modification protein YeaZ